MYLSVKDDPMCRTKHVLDSLNVLESFSSFKNCKNNIITYLYDTLFVLEKENRKYKNTREVPLIKDEVSSGKFSLPPKLYVKSFPKFLILGSTSLTTVVG